MFKPKHLATLIFLLPLAACSAKSSSVIPAGGSSIAIEEGTAALNSALAAVPETGNIGIQATGLEFSVDYHNYTARDVDNDWYLFPEDITASLSNASLTLMARGLTGDEIDFKASAEAKGDLALDIDMMNVYETYDNEQYALSSEEFVAKKNISGIDAKAYVSANHVYLDATDPDFVSLLTFIMGLGGETASESSAASFPSGKYDLGLFFEQNEEPIITEEMLASYQDFVGQLTAYVEAYPQYFTTVKYDNGVYGLSFALTKADLTEAISEAMSSASEAEQVLAVINEYLDINSLAAGITFDETGILTASFDIDVALSAPFGFFNQGMSLSSADAAKTVSYGVVAKGSLAFLYGSGVTVTLPSDLADYVPTYQE